MSDPSGPDRPDSSDRPDPHDHPDGPGAGHDDEQTSDNSLDIQDKSTDEPIEPDEPTPARIPGGLLARGSWREASYVRDLLRQETVGGGLLLVAAVAALLWANSPWREGYSTLRDTYVGVKPLSMSIGHWSADALLAIFFLVAGIELKREFVAGDLSDRKKAAVPIVAAASGVVVPALIFVAVAVGMGADSATLAGWAIPTATDIAFALAVLAVIGSHLPSALRAFLLTLAVVDDLIAITIIALFYTTSLEPLWLLAALAPLLVWWFLVRRRTRNPFLLAVPALLAWTFVYLSGVHATVAGVLLGLLVPVSVAAERSADDHSYAERMEHRLRPLSAGFAVPVFAFFAAGVTVVGGGFAEAFGDPVLFAIIAGLVGGKTIGVMGGTWLLARFTRARLDPSLSWRDLFGLSLLAGVGFTVSLLIGELAFGVGSDKDDHVKLGVLLGSLIAASLATLVLRLRNAHYRQIELEESVDRNADGVPDVYQQHR